MRYLLLTGLSGAGKTAALRFLEDMGVFCIDNLPPMMIMKFMEMWEAATPARSCVAFSVDARSGSFFDAHSVTKLILETKQLGKPVETIFLEASDDALVQRYKETRREHPLAGDSVTLTEAIAKDREMLQPLRETADHIIDTTGMKTRALQKALRGILSAGAEETDALRVEVLSFGFKRGLPRQADLVLDVRFLPNPFYIPELCRHSGLDEDVRDYVMNSPVTQEFMEKTCAWLDFLLPHYRDEGKRRLMIAVGCTGGAHRSVAIAEAIAAHLRTQDCRVEIGHRDIDVEQAHWTQEEE